MAERPDGAYHSYNRPAGASGRIDRPPGRGSGKVTLIGKVDAYEDRVATAVIIGKEDGVVAISSDKTIKVWIKRSTGQYWPSISHSLPGAPVCMDYSLVTRQLLVGLDTGLIMEFEIADDYNKLARIREYHVHQGSVLGVVAVPANQWVLSCGSDSRFVCHSSESSGRAAVVYQTVSSPACLQYDTRSCVAFVGDTSGSILALRLIPPGGGTGTSGDAPQKLASLKKHSEAIQCLLVDKLRPVLYSASLDRTVVVWDIKDNDYSAITLTGHTAAVRHIRLCLSTNELLSVSDDSTLICWDMNCKRDPVVAWRDADACEVCASPFLWNLRSMWDQKTFGVRQHHCRRCGRALCANCVPHTDLIPRMGFECPVRTCVDCHQQLDSEQQESAMTRHDLFHAAHCVDVDEVKKSILSVGKDKVIKIWDASSVLK